MTRTAIIAAMPGELKTLVRGWRHEKRNRVNLWRWRYDGGEWIAACAGAGQNAATRALAEIEKDGPVASVVSVGWVGALSNSYLPGQAYRIAGVVDTLTGERFRIARLREETAPQGLKPGTVSFTSIGTAKAVPFQSSAEAGAVAFQNSAEAKVSPLQEPAKIKAVPIQNAPESIPSDIWLATSPKVADAAEKQRLAATYKAGLVDMEAAAIARLAGMRGISFQCIKGVSDGLNDRLPDFNRFLTREGQFRMAGFTLFALFHPGYWSVLKQMGENSKKASRSIAESVRELLDPSGSIYKGSIHKE
jgi:nucleoside phosphorylase